MRLFIASPVKLDNYASIQEDFKDIIEGKWVKEGNLHLTWVFLGDIRDEKPVIDKFKKILPLESEVDIEEIDSYLVNLSRKRKLKNILNSYEINQSNIY